MDTDKKKRTLREAYDAMHKGEAYQQKLINAGMEFNATRVRAAFFGLVTAAVMVPAMTVLLGLPEHGNDLFRAVAGGVGVIGGGAVMWYLAWRMMRGNVLEKIYVDLDNEPADPDGVERTRDEHVFLASPFAHTKMFLIFTRCVIGRAKASYAEVTETVSSTDDPDVVEVGNTLSRVSDRFARLEVMLEAQWSECPPDARDAPSTRDGLRDICQQLTVLNIQAVDCLTFIYRHYS